MNFHLLWKRSFLIIFLPTLHFISSNVSFYLNVGLYSKAVIRLSYSRGWTQHTVQEYESLHTCFEILVKWDRLKEWPELNIKRLIKNDLDCDKICPLHLMKMRCEIIHLSSFWEVLCYKSWNNNSINEKHSKSSNVCQSSLLSIYV